MRNFPADEQWLWASQNSNGKRGHVETGLRPVQAEQGSAVLLETSALSQEAAVPSIIFPTSFAQEA
jgi:hypothetical protein